VTMLALRQMRGGVEFHGNHPHDTR
jgi:hypothetical protein